MRDMAGRVLGISELALWVSDVRRATEFYRDVLGFEVESIDQGRNAFLRSGDFLLVLFNPRDPGTQLASEYLSRHGAPRGDVYHVAFKVEPTELHMFAEQVRGHGVEVRGPVEFSTGRRSYFVEDPDEHLIELTDR